MDISKALDHCQVCERPLEIDDMVVKVYRARECAGFLDRLLASITTGISVKSRDWVAGFAHLTCPMENFIPCDNSPDAVCMPLGGGSKAAMDYVQEQNDPKE